MREGKKEFQKELLQIAVPVTLQCLMQSSFSVVDQIMTGQLGMAAAFVFHLPIAAVYFVLSMEECIRMIISLVKGFAMDDERLKNFGIVLPKDKNPRRTALRRI